MAIITCPECGKEISSSAKACPNCGYERQLKKPKTGFMDACCIISLVVNIAMCIFGLSMIAYVLNLVWLIIYLFKYNKYKKKPEYDVSGLKVSMITIFLIFIGTCVFTI